MPSPAKRGQEAQPLLAIGGIGDFLQNIAFLLDAKPKGKIILASNFAHASQFFARFGILVVESHYFSTLEEQHRVCASLREMPGFTPCPRQQYFTRSPLPSRELSFTRPRPVIGVHLHGSKFSIDVQRRVG